MQYQSYPGLIDTCSLSMIGIFGTPSVGRDAQATRITLVRGKEAGDHYLRIIDDGPP